MAYNIVGLDLSLTSPGMACLQVKEDGTYELLDFATCKTAADESWHTRLKRVNTTTLEFVVKHLPKQIFVEGYSYGSVMGREIAGEVHGVTLFQLLEQGFPPQNIHRSITPQARAKFLTGNGRASKGEVVKAVNEFFGLNLRVKDNDIADACVLAFIGYCINHFDTVEPTLNKDQKAILKKVMENKGGF